MKRLILTTFDYRADFDGGKTNRGSYLGRKPASEKTIRRFLAMNARKLNLPDGVISVRLTGSNVSPWLYR